MTDPDSVSKAPSAHAKGATGDSRRRGRELRVMMRTVRAALPVGGLYGYVVAVHVLRANVHLESYGQRLAVLVYFTLAFGCILLGGAVVVGLLAWVILRRARAFRMVRPGKVEQRLFVGGMVLLLLLLGVTPFCLSRRAPFPSAEQGAPQQPPLAECWNRRKLVVIGIDGLSWKLLRPLLDQGRLPRFQQLCEGGSFGVLETLSPTLSPPIWTTIVTGKRPEQHGILDFTERTFFPLPYRLRALPAGLGLNRLYRYLSRWGLADQALVTRRARRTKALWNIFDDVGMRSVVVSWWASWPAERLCGVIVTDHVNVARMSAYRQLGMKAESAPSDRFAGDVAPIGLLPELLPLVQDPELLSASDVLELARLDAKDLQAVAATKQYARDDRYSIIKFELAADQTNYRIGRRLFEDDPWDAFFLYLPGLDGFQHHFYQFRFPSQFDIVDPSERAKFQETIDSYYVYLDRLLAALLEGIDEETYFLVVSDHGIEANPDYSPEEGKGYNQYASGVHTQTAPGAFLLRGPAVRRNYEVKSCSVLDITPTLLALLGLPVGEDMAGRVLTELAEPGSAAFDPVKTVLSYDVGYRPEAIAIEEAPDPRLLERLRALGYFD